MFSMKWWILAIPVVYVLSEERIDFFCSTLHSWEYKPIFLFVVREKWFAIRKILISDWQTIEKCTRKNTHSSLLRKRKNSYQSIVYLCDGMIYIWSDFSFLSIWVQTRKKCIFEMKNKKMTEFVSNEPSTKIVSARHRRRPFWREVVHDWIGKSVSCDRIFCTLFTLIHSMTCPSSGIRQKEILLKWKMIGNMRHLYITWFHGMCELSMEMALQRSRGRLLEDISL